MSLRSDTVPKPSRLIGLTVLIVLAVGAAAGADWPQWRGPSLDGTADGGAPLALQGGAGLRAEWRRALGSGYSSLSVSGDRLVTMASIDGGDYVLALDPASGAEIWRHRVADTYLGRAGSDDGPSSTPALDASAAYALTASGHLVSLELATGALRWKRHLEEDFGAEPHTYGYSTAPAVFEDLVLVLGGPEQGSAVIALDAATGRRRWAAGSGAVHHQNPLVATLAGALQVIVPTVDAVAGYGLTDGAELWRHEYGAYSQSGDVTAIDSERLLVTRWDGNTLLHLTREGEALRADEVWTTRELKGTYAVPVRRGDSLYGFNSRFLTCVSLATGERVWRSRPPGGSGLILVDGLLAILAPDGDLVMAEASPEGYRELSRLPLFAPRRVMTPPSVARGSMFVRNLDEVVAVRPGEAPPSVVAELSDAGKNADDDPFDHFLERVRRAENKLAVVDDFLSRHPVLPLVAEERVHFLYRGEVEDLAVTGDMTGGFAELAMRRIPGTDLFHRAFDAPTGERWEGERWEYVFKSFEETILDPRNPSTVATPGGERSVASPSGSPSQTGGVFCPECSAGRLATVHLEDNETKAGYGLTIYLPAAYDEELDRDFPLLLWVLGREALDYGRIPEVLDSVAGRTSEPSIAAFLELPGGLIWEPQRSAFARLMSEEVLPTLEATFRVAPESANRALIVQQWAMENGLPWALGEARVGKLGAQSPMMGEHYVERAATPAADTENKLFVYLDWGRYDGRNLDWALDVPAQAAALAEVLERAGHSVRAVETPGGGNWARWRQTTAEMLETLFPRVRQGPASR